MRARERHALNYAQELKKKYGHFPEVRRIARHRHLPKHIYNAKNEHRIMKESRSRKYACIFLLYCIVISLMHQVVLMETVHIITNQEID